VQVIVWLASAVHRLLAYHQSDSQQAALADCLTDVDALITTCLICCETCNPGGVGFLQIVEIRPDPNSHIRYPSIPSIGQWP